MKRRAIFICLFALLFIANCNAKKSGSRGSSGGWFKSSSSKSRNTPRPSQTHSAQPPAPGWNVNPKPSAPVNDHHTRTSATSVNSGYPGSQQYPQGPHQTYPQSGYNPGYNPGGYNQGGYNQGGYHAPAGYPSANQPYGGYHPSAGHSPMGYNPSMSQPAQTVVLQPKSPGIGTLAKEALVFSAVSAGTNAVINRVIPGGIYGGHGGGSSSSGVPATNTHITYNNYYNNGSDPGTANPAPVAGALTPQAATPLQAAPAPAPGNPQSQPDPVAPNTPNQPPANNGVLAQSPSGHQITNVELGKLTEDLYNKDTNNAFPHTSMNLKGQKTDNSSTDDASDPLLVVKSEAYEIPTVKSVLALHDNYELNVRTKETVTPEERKEESDLLDAFLSTDVMKTTMKYLSDNEYVPNDEYEFKDTLRRIWFSPFKRIDGDPASSGFETVYLAEEFDSEVIGNHNWIYYAKMEEANKMNYLGFIKKVDLGNKGAIVKVRSKLNEIVQPMTTLFIGTSPELEMALYTICFYIRPNDACPVSLGGTQFIIVVNRVNYFGKDILVAAYPDI